MMRPVVLDQDGRPLVLGEPVEAKFRPAMVAGLHGDRYASVVLDDDGLDDGPEQEAADLAALREHGPSVAAGPLLVDPVPRVVRVGGEYVRRLP